ncbi:hypothetical protein TVAG_357570 [Trichomonas vaginalis G3]|uniref:Uncharacterized protein n=1 Tax=Trichomonas vaginalis (strain ATCC PRA-98 / G3) TaxID=412133 RepID=A2G1D9_TRIV3|nr:hypothetical protein TVAG_357570 [Trichomonas vaginalis G3]|eukprot:XP_001301949.1 hypothetical protein [Trichomonas vaginalis G3]
MVVLFTCQSIRILLLDTPIFNQCTAFDARNGSGGAIFTSCSKFQIYQCKCVQCYADWVGQAIFASTNGDITFNESTVSYCAPNRFFGAFYSVNLFSNFIVSKNVNSTDNRLMEYGASFHFQNSLTVISSYFNVGFNLGRSIFCITTTENQINAFNYINFFSNDAKTPGVIMFSGPSAFEDCVFVNNTGTLISVNWEYSGLITLTRCSFDIPPTQSEFIETISCNIDPNPTLNPNKRNH